MATSKEKLFRAVSLEKFSSPDQLDQLLRVTSARQWAALLAVFLLLGTTAVWAYRGSIGTKVSGQAVVVRAGGMIAVTAQGAGQVVSLTVKAGEKVKANEVIARIAQPALMERIRAAQDALDEARRESDRSVRVRGEAANLQVASIGRQRDNLQREIKEFEEQAKLAAEQIPVEEQLLEKGLNTKQQVIAARQKLISIQAEIARHRAQLTQLDAQQYATESEPAQVQADSQAKVAGLERRLSELRQEMALAANVLTPYDGQVVELKAQPGSAVSIGTALLTLQPAADVIEVLAYVPADHAKEVAAGMEAQVSPSTVKREEFGYIKGSIISVAEFPATHAALMRNFENETLVQSLQKSGPVTEMRVRLTPDPTTPSGFRWSSSKGPMTTISPGTICGALIVTREQQPITLLFPTIRQKLGL